jgi:malate/lactate dehydrogenase
VERIVALDLTADEKAMLEKSADSVKKVRDLVKSKG